MFSRSLWHWIAISILWKNICLAGSTATDFLSKLNYSMLSLMTLFDAFINSFCFAII